MNVRHIQTIWMKEIRTYFSSPIAYVIAAVFVAEEAFELAWLWRNTVGTGATVIAGFCVSRAFPDR